MFSIIYRINHKSQSVKRLTCCNILGSKIPSGIKVSFEITVKLLLVKSFGLFYNLEHHNFVLKVFDSAQSRSRNMVKSLGYCIKQIDFILPWVCTAPRKYVFGGAIQYFAGQRYTLTKNKMSAAFNCFCGESGRQRTKNLKLRAHTVNLAFKLNSSFG